MTAEAAQDTEHLRLLSIFHYVVAGLQGLFACFPVLHFAIGAVLVFLPEQLNDGKAGPPPVLVGWFFMLFAGAWILVGLTLAACIAIAGRNLAQRRRYLFCLVMAGVEAATCMPLGTVLGVFTILVLMRPTVKEAFGVS